MGCTGVLALFVAVFGSLAGFRRNNIESNSQTLGLRDVSSLRVKSIKGIEGN
jgi:hypothetical protein